MRRQGITATSYNGRSWFARCCKHGKRLEKFSGFQQGGPMATGIVKIHICPECSEGKLMNISFFGTIYEPFHLVGGRA